MSHVFTREFWENEASGTSSGEREWSRQFKVVYDSLEQAPTVLDAPDIPLRWEPHPLDARLLAMDANSKNWQGDPLTWLVTVKYSSLTDTEDRGDDDPRNRPIEYETDSISFQAPMVSDKDGKAVLNSAKEPFDPPYQMEDSRPVIRISRFESNLDEARSLAYRNAINTDAWGIYAAGELMCMFIKQKRHFENQIECWHTSYEFQGKANGTVTSNNALLAFKGWDAVLLDAGFNQIKNGKLENILTEGKAPRPVSAPVRLNGSGVALLSSDSVDTTRFLVFRPPYRYQSFASLGLL